MNGPGASFNVLRDKRNLRGDFAGMQHVPALAIVGIAIKLFVAGHAPHIRSHAIFFFEDRLRLQHFIHDGSAAQQLHAQLRIRRV